MNIEFGRLSMIQQWGSDHEGSALEKEDKRATLETVVTIDLKTTLGSSQTR